MAITNIIVSIITAITALIAIVISVVEIRKSNKQALFDRRLNAYLALKWMESLCEENKVISRSYLNDGKTKPLHAIDYMFNIMTNCTFLEEIQGTLSHTLESEYQRKYLIKIESMKKTSEEVRLIFPGSIGKSLADFIYDYAEMLVAMYKYKVAFEEISEECKKFKRPFPSDNQLENECRQTIMKYLSETFELADKIQKDGTLQKATTQIRI